MLAVKSSTSFRNFVGVSTSCLPKVKSYDVKLTPFTLPSSFEEKKKQYKNNLDNLLHFSHKFGKKLVIYFGNYVQLLTDT